MKVQPEAPTCSSSAGDDKASSGTIDLAIASSYAGYYYVTNAAMEREANDNLRAETDGVFVEGAEVYVSAGEGGGMIGGSEYYLFNQFIGPESSDIVAAVAIPPTVVEELATQYGCTRAWSYGADDIYGAIEGAEAAWPPASEYYGYVYAVVRFIGHTQGGSEVMTQEYSFMINLCCNCLVEWNNCLTLCDAYCGDADDPTMCQPGVANGSGEGWDCRDIGYGRYSQWTESEVVFIDPEDVDSDSDSDTEMITVELDCENCSPS
jgi:hypothetical protein